MMWNRWRIDLEYDVKLTAIKTGLSTHLVATNFQIKVHLSSVNHGIFTFYRRRHMSLLSTLPRSHRRQRRPKMGGVPTLPRCKRRRHMSLLSTLPRCHRRQRRLTLTLPKRQETPIHGRRAGYSKEAEQEIRILFSENITAGFIVIREVRAKRNAYPDFNQHLLDFSDSQIKDKVWSLTRKLDN